MVARRLCAFATYVSCDYARTRLNDGLRCGHKRGCDRWVIGRRGMDRGVEATHKRREAHSSDWIKSCNCEGSFDDCRRHRVRAAESLALVSRDWPGRRSSRLLLTARCSSKQEASGHQEGGGHMLSWQCEADGAIARHCSVRPARRDRRRSSRGQSLAEQDAERRGVGEPIASERERPRLANVPWLTPLTQCLPVGLSRLMMNKSLRGGPGIQRQARIWFPRGFLEFNQSKRQKEAAGKPAALKVDKQGGGKQRDRSTRAKRGQFQS